MLAKPDAIFALFQYLWMNSQVLSNQQSLDLFSKKAEKLMSQIRSILLLPLLSKVIEKVVYEQETKFLNDINIF